LSKIRAYILDLTEKGVRLASLKRPKGVWFPRSTITSKYSQEPLMFQIFVIQDWIMKKKRLVK
jgi:hypothetical protein